MSILLQLCSALDADRFSLVGPTVVNVNLGLITISNSSGGVVVNRFSLEISTLMDSNSAIAVSALINDSTKIMPVARLSTRNVKIIDLTVKGRTEDIKNSKEASIGFNVFFGIKDHGASIFIVRKEAAGFSRDFSDNLAIGIDLLEGNVNSSKCE